jgi:transcriptional regulator with XRE-family HTH domain
MCTALELGLKIRSARKARGLTQAATAALLQTITQDQLSRIERGQRSMRAEDLLHLRTILALRLEDMQSPTCPLLSP